MLQAVSKWCIKSLSKHVWNILNLFKISTTYVPWMSAACLRRILQAQGPPQTHGIAPGRTRSGTEAMCHSRCGTDVSFHVFPMFPCTVCALRIVCVVSSGLVALLRSAEDADVTELLRLRFRPWTSTQWSWSDHKARLNKNQDQPTRTNKALNISHMYCDQHEGTWSNNTPYCHSLPYFRVLCSWFRAQDVEWTFSWRGTFFQLRRWFSLEVSRVNGQHGSTYKGRRLKTLCPGLKRETVLELHRLNLGTLPWRTLGVLPPCAQGELAAKPF